MWDQCYICSILPARTWTDTDTDGGCIYGVGRYFISWPFYKEKVQNQKNIFSDEERPTFKKKIMIHPDPDKYQRAAADVLPPAIQVMRRAT